MIKSRKINFACLAALCLVGNTLLNIKFTGNTANDIIGVLGSVAASAVTVFFLKWLIGIPTAKKLKNTTLFFGAAMFLGLILLASIIVFTLENFSRFAADTMLSVKDIFIPFVSLLAIAMLLGLSEKKILLKLSVIILPLSFIILTAVFLYSIRFMSIKYFIPYKAIDSGWLTTFLPLYLNLTFSSIPLTLAFKNEKKRVFAYSFLAVFIILALCCATTLGIFGSELASTFSYPYYRAVSSAAMGEIFSRLDGFFYFVCFFTVLLKTATFIYVFKKMFLKLINKIKY